MNKLDRRVKGLGEVSTRVRDLDTMHKFYKEVIGLEALRRDESFVFFKIAEGYGSHTQNLALFEASNTMFLDNKAVQLNQQETTLHHIALNIALEDFESEKKRLEGLGLKVNATVHEWHFVSARCTSPTQKGICWCLPVTMQAWDRGNAGTHSKSGLTSPV
ncbi:MAG TPA: VOC family protein [Anaerolineales bacterium]|nr:VOC family protein [Anaerolineales bacterium]